MSEHEKFEQVGRLAEEVSHLKGELSHINEKLQRAYSAYQLMTNGQVAGNWRVQNGQVFVPQTSYNPGQPRPSLEALLGYPELKEVLEKKQELEGKLEQVTERLKSLAPHLF